MIFCYYYYLNILFCYYLKNHESVTVLEHGLWSNLNLGSQDMVTGIGFQNKLFAVELFWHQHLRMLPSLHSRVKASLKDMDCDTDPPPGCILSISSLCFCGSGCAGHPVVIHFTF